MEIGNIFQNVYDDMECGVNNFCDSNGNCIGCGECCSALLPMSDKEIRIIEKFVRKKHYKPHRHMDGAPFARPMIDLTCPFLNNEKGNEKCDIYSIRPKICRTFKCNVPPSKIRDNKEEFRKTRNVFNMWELFK